MPMTATAIPPSAGPRIEPAWLTLLWYETPADRLLARDDLGLEGRQRRPLEAAGHAGHEDDDEDAERGPASRLADRTARAAAQSVADALVTRTIVRRSHRSATWPPNSTSDERRDCLDEARASRATTGHG